jgi:hypothetical protein
MNNITTVNLPEVSLLDLGINFAICLILTVVCSWHYNKRAQKRVLRRDLGVVLPVIALTTLLIISVVKSSLALSLGLVGALSIVRFRTPIKEPEELAYIFLSIVIGLSLGADQRETATLGVLVILTFISGSNWLRTEKRKQEGNLLVTVNIPKEGMEEKNELHSATDILLKIGQDLNIRRIDKRPEVLVITCIARFDGLTDMKDFSTEFSEHFPKGSFTILDDSSLPNE